MTHFVKAALIYYVTDNNKEYGMNNWQSKTAAELAALVEYHNLRYWVLNAPEISDTEYDLLVETLRQKDPAASPLEEIKSYGTLDYYFVIIDSEGECIYQGTDIAAFFDALRGSGF